MLLLVFSSALWKLSWIHSVFFSCQILVIVNSWLIIHFNIWSCEIFYLAYVPKLSVFYFIFPGILSSRIVSLGSIVIFTTHEWLPMKPIVYFHCQGENKTVLPDVKEKDILYTFRGEESWQVCCRWILCYHPFPALFSILTFCHLVIGSKWWIFLIFCQWNIKIILKHKDNQFNSALRFYWYNGESGLDSVCLVTVFEPKWATKLDIVT